MLLGRFIGKVKINKFLFPKYTFYPDLKIE